MFDVSCPTHNVNYMSSTLNGNFTIPRVSRGAQTLHTGGIPRCTNAAYRGCPEVHKRCVPGVSRGAQTLRTGGIPRCTNAAYRGYPEVHKRCILRVSRGTQTLHTEGVPRYTNAAYRGYPEVHKPEIHSRPGLVQREQDPLQTPRLLHLAVDRVLVPILDHAWGYLLV